MQQESTTQLSEVLYLINKLEQATLPQGLREQIELKLKRLRRMARQGQSAGEYETVAKYIDWCMSIPWGKYVSDNLDLNNAKAVIDNLHYGSEYVKEVILEYLAVLNRKHALSDMDYSAPVLAFVGVQGAGKTSIAKAISAALGRPFVRIALGGISSATELRGSPSSELTGAPGQILKAIIKSGCLNPVILLDEFDKVSGSESSRQDFMAIMLEILDPQQNKTFRDLYVDYPVDLSKIMFIATANRFKTISRELLDRIEFIEFPDYTLEEKQVIAQRYLFPKILQYAGLRPGELEISQDAWHELVRVFATDQGVRRLESNLKKLARTVTKAIVQGKYQQLHIDSSNVAEFTKLVLASVEDVRNKDFTAQVVGPAITSNSDTSVISPATIPILDSASASTPQSSSTTNPAPLPPTPQSSSTTNPAPLPPTPQSSPTTNPAPVPTTPQSSPTTNPAPVPTTPTSSSTTNPEPVPTTPTSSPSSTPPQAPKPITAANPGFSSDPLSSSVSDPVPTSMPTATSTPSPIPVPSAVSDPVS